MRKRKRSVRDLSFALVGRRLFARLRSAHGARDAHVTLERVVLAPGERAGSWHLGFRLAGEIPECQGTLAWILDEPLWAALPIDERIEQVIAASERGALVGMRASGMVG